MAQKKIGRQLLDTFDKITALIEVTDDPARLKKLETQSSRLKKEIGRLIDANLDSSDADYKAATNALQDASDQIQDAIKKIDTVVAAIEALAKALDLVAELAA
jgi:hypothetical protein